MTFKPRPGSAFYRRTDGGFTGLGHQVSGQGHLEGRAWVTPEERMAAEAQQPQTTVIFDQGSDAEQNGFEVERVAYPYDFEALVVLAPSTPPFGTWEQIEDWPGEE